MAARKRRPQAEFSEATLDALIGDVKTPEDLDALFRQMKKALAERILNAELTHLTWATGPAKPSRPSKRISATAARPKRS